MPSYACVTLITTPSYVVGAEVLGYSLKRSGWPHETAVMVTPNIDQAHRDRLSRYWNRVVEVEPLGNPNPLRDQGTSYFGTLYTKLRLWGLTEFDKVVFLDADTVVLGSLEDLLDRPDFAAAPCMGGLDAFNGGVVVARPSKDTLEDMLAKVPSLPSYDGSEQGFLNSYFSDWYTGSPERRLPAIYNVPHILYFYHPSWNRLRKDMRVLHFFGARKPWGSRSWLAKTLTGKVQRSMVERVGDGPNPRQIWWSLHREMEG